MCCCLPPFFSGVWVPRPAQLGGVPAKRRRGGQSRADIAGWHRPPSLTPSLHCHVSPPFIRLSVRRQSPPPSPPLFASSPGLEKKQEEAFTRPLKAARTGGCSWGIIWRKQVLRLVSLGWGGGDYSCDGGWGREQRNGEREGGGEIRHT